jgi:2,3-bisphosphoglycerate-dependent phosphoglycerate mutase
MQPIISRNQPIFYNLSRKKIGELFIIRHAKSDHNVQGCCAGHYNSSKPTEDGIEKTRKGGKLLSKSGIKFDTLYVSPLHRALITAQVLLKDLPPIKITTTEALVERNFGAFTGMSKNKIEEKLNPEEFNKYIHDKNFFPPDIGPGHKYFQSEELYGAWPDNHKGESYQCVINRLNPFLEKVKVELLNGQNILIIGHSHNLQILQMLLYGNTFDRGIEEYIIEHATPIKFTLSLNYDNQLIVKEKVNLSEVAIMDEWIKPML